MAKTGKPYPDLFSGSRICSKPLDRALYVTYSWLKYFNFAALAILWLFGGKRFVYLA